MRLAGYCAGLWLLTCLATPALAKDVGNALTTTRIAPGVFFHAGQQAEENTGNRGDIANIGFVVGSRCVAVVDTGGSPAIGQALRAAIRKQTQLPICYVINTHMHPDHVLGNRAFVDTHAVFVAGDHFAAALTARARTYLDRLSGLLDREADKSWIVLPDKTVAVGAPVTLDLGDRQLRLTAWPTAHTDNDLTVYDEKTRTLWAGDLLFVNRAPAIDGSITGWLAAIERLGSRSNVAHVVPGHGPPGQDWRAQLRTERDYLVAVRDGVNKMLDSGRSLAYASKHVAMDQKHDWLLFDAYNARNVTAAYTELEWQ